MQSLLYRVIIVLRERQMERVVGTRKKGTTFPGKTEWASLSK